MKKNKALIFALLAIALTLLFHLIPKENTPAEIAKKYTALVVCIQNYSADENGEKLLRSEGSGFFISDSGHIATNAHVVRDAAHLEVILSTGEHFGAELLGADKGTDIAVLKIESDKHSFFRLNAKCSLTVGETVIAIGNPGGYDFAGSVTQGIASSVGREIALQEFGYTLSTIQTDTAINPGNSGGPLINLKGEVVGICSAKFAEEGFEGMGFAISTAEAIPVLKELIQYGKVRERSVLGVSGFYIDKSTAERFCLVPGFYIEDIRSTFAAFLNKGDVITKIDGNEIDSPVVIKDATKDKKPGGSVILEFYSAEDGKTHEAKLILIESE